MTSVRDNLDTISSGAQDSRDRRRSSWENNYYKIALCVCVCVCVWLAGIDSKRGEGGDGVGARKR